MFVITIQTTKRNHFFGFRFISRNITKYYLGLHAGPLYRTFKGIYLSNLSCSFKHTNVCGWCRSLRRTTTGSSGSGSCSSSGSTCRRHDSFFAAQISYYCINVV